MLSPDDPFLNSRFDAITEAQKRARIALLASVLAAGAIVAGLWNEFFSWDRQWAEVQEAPKPWGQQQLISEQIKAWMESNTVGISILGIRLSISDVAVLGTLVLLVFAFYHALCLRRENHEVGSLLRDVRNEPSELRQIVYQRIRAFAVFMTIRADRGIYNRLDGPIDSTHTVVFVSPLLWVLTFLPAVTVALIIASDIYFSFLFVSPWRGNSGPAWNTLAPAYKTQLVLTDIFALLFGILVLIYCRSASNYRRATSHILEQFSALERTLNNAQAAGTEKNGSVSIEPNK